MTYSTPTSQDLGDLFSLWAWVNTVSNGIFSAMILLVIFMVIFLGGLMTGSRANRTWTFASFICLIISILMAVTNLLNKNYLYLCILLLAGGLVWIKLGDSYE
jgi:cell division protein FtsW (lipid II flippase)